MIPTEAEAKRIQDLAVQINITKTPLSVTQAQELLGYPLDTAIETDKTKLAIETEAKIRVEIAKAIIRQSYN